MKAENKQFRRCDLRVISFAVHHSFGMRFARAMARLTSCPVRRVCWRGLGVDRLVELFAFADMTVQTNLGSHKICRISGRRLPGHAEVLIRAGLALREGETDPG